MAQRLLDSLPKVPKDQLPSGAECMICKEEYGTVPSDNGTVEHAVWLPCLHHVGSECIAVWLSPGDGLGNSCPLCRTVFFENYLRDYDEDGDGDGYGDSEDSDDEDEEEEEEEGSDEEDEDQSDEEGDEDEGDEGDDGSENRRQQSPMTSVAASRRSASSSVNTRSSQQQRTESQHAQACFRRCPLLTTTQQIEHSGKRAWSQLLPSPLPLLLLSSTFLQQKNPSAQTHSPPPPPIIADLETTLKHLASALASRQPALYYSYMLLLLSGAIRIPPLGNVKGGTRTWGLSPLREEMLLLRLEMGRREAVADKRSRRGFMPMAMTNRQEWDAHGAMGEVLA